MMSQSSEEMIRDLTADLPPVAPLARLRVTVLRAMGIALPFLGAWVLMSGVRDQLHWGEWPEPAYLLAAMVCLLLASGGTLAGLAAAIPGREVVFRLGRNVFLAGVALGISALVYEFKIGNAPPFEAARSGVPCVVAAILLAVPIAWFLARFVANGAAAQPMRAAAFACSGAVGFSAATVHLTCSDPTPVHMFLGHGLAPLVGGLLLLTILSIGLALTSRVGRLREN